MFHYTLSSPVNVIVTMAYKLIKLKRSCGKGVIDGQKACATLYDLWSAGTFVFLGNYHHFEQTSFPDLRRLLSHHQLCFNGSF